MQAPRLIIGLGNPGRKYKQSRHNLGFMVVDHIADEYDLNWGRGRGNVKIAKGMLRTKSVILAKPQTFMNLSGSAVIQLLYFYKIETSALLIVCDDVNLPFGRIRLRGRGSDGGHNGLGSIIQSLRTLEFARLRIGIGSDYSDGELTTHVLGKFNRRERENINSAITLAAEAVVSFVCDGLETAMNAHNRVD